MEKANIDFAILRKKLRVMRQIGVPYTDDQIENASFYAERDAKALAKNLREQGAPAGLEEKEIVALIAYLQAMGQTSTAPQAGK